MIRVWSKPLFGVQCMQGLSRILALLPRPVCAFDRNQPSDSYLTMLTLPVAGQKRRPLS